MTCNKCERTLTQCICDDCDERIAALAALPGFAIGFDVILAQRLLNKFDIERDRNQANKDGREASA